MRTLSIPTALAAIAAVLLVDPLSAGVLQLNIDGAINPATVEVVKSAVVEASHENDEALLIRLNTPGGLVDSTREIVEQFFHSSVPVIVWVGPAGARAASAGFFLLEAADVAAMAPGTNTGASHPVSATGSTMDETMKTKVENDAAALMRSIATHRGRDAQVAEKAVRESASWTEHEALEHHLIDVIAADPAGVIAQTNGRPITRFNGQIQTAQFPNKDIEAFQPSLRDRILLAISDPNFALLLLILGALGIYVEFSSPGLVLPGVAGAVLVLLGLTSLSMFPIDWLGAALMFIGLVCFILEAKFMTHGVLTAGGAVALAVGAVLLINTTVPELQIHWSTAIALVTPFALITTFLLSIAMRAHRNKVVTGPEGMLGMEGVAISELDPSGTILVRGEYWKADSPTHVSASEPVRITGVDGLTLHVAPEHPESRESVQKEH